MIGEPPSAPPLSPHCLSCTLSTYVPPPRHGAATGATVRRSRGRCHLCNHCSCSHRRLPRRRPGRRPSHSNDSTRRVRWQIGVAMKNDSSGTATATGSVEFATKPRVAADPTPPSTASWATGRSGTRVRGTIRRRAQCVGDNATGALHGVAAARLGQVQQKKIDWTKSR